MKVIHTEMTHIVIKPREGAKNFQKDISDFMEEEVDYIQKLYPKLQVIGIGTIKVKIPSSKKRKKSK